MCGGMQGEGQHKGKWVLELGAQARRGLEGDEAEFQPQGRGSAQFRLSWETWATVISLSQKMKLKQGCGHMTGGSG